jgi:hypothetical protein
MDPDHNVEMDDPYGVGMGSDEHDGLSNMEMDGSDEQHQRPSAVEVDSDDEHHHQLDTLHDVEMDHTHAVEVDSTHNLEMAGHHHGGMGGMEGYPYYDKRGKRLHERRNVDGLGRCCREVGLARQQEKQRRHSQDANIFS